MNNALQNQSRNRVTKWEKQKGLATKGDKTLVRVMLENLLGNAWKYTAKVPRTQIKFYKLSVNGSPEAFCVEDNGTGFDIEYKEKIFQPFQRFHTGQEFEGTGIGLATVNRVIHRHAGSIWVESTRNEGSRFYFRL